MQVEELKARLDEKSRMVEKKTASAMAAAHELAELRDHSEIKDRKINVLQRKVNKTLVILEAKSQYHGPLTGDKFTSLTFRTLKINF